MKCKLKQSNKNFIIHVQLKFQNINAYAEYFNRKITFHLNFPLKCCIIFLKAIINDKL